VLGDRAAAVPWISTERVDHVAHVPRGECRAHPVRNPELRRHHRGTAQPRRPRALARPAAHAVIVTGQPGTTCAETDLLPQAHLTKLSARINLRDSALSAVYGREILCVLLTRGLLPALG